MTASATEKLIETKITQAVTKPDKNGNDYTRFIVQEERELNGIEYEVGIPVMSFGELVEKAKTYKEGDTVKAIVSVNEYQGRTSYNVIAFVQ